MASAGDSYVLLAVRLLTDTVSACFYVGIHKIILLNSFEHQ